ncbi:MAG TPA: hypothetical protein VHM25_25405 [Polyangiaceae bacterium]|jgi:hypothetical protein|nr:hypothetical protein [Polyangiaceae bacterium]
MDQSEHGSHERNKLRGAIAEMTLRVAGLSDKGEAETGAERVESLERSWQALISLIQPEPEPTRRQCPHCRGQMRENATRCVYCLCKSVPPAAEAGGAA